MIRILIGVFIVCIYSAPVISANLLFKSGFEGNVAMAPMSTAFNRTSSYQNLTGTDVSGYSWPMQIRSSNRASLHHIINVGSNPPPPVSDLNEYFDTHIETVKGRDGLPTRALYQSLIQKASRITQSWYEVYYSSPSAISDRDVYIKYWMKFPGDLKESMGPDNWRSVFFWKTSDNDYRIEAYIYTNHSINADGTPFWHIHGDRFATIGGEYEKDWEVNNMDIAVPIGEWFLVEFFWHRSTGNDGRFFWAVNGHVIADHRGPNFGDYNKRINRVSPFGIYTTPAIYPARQWIDDVEVWDGFPCGEGVSCFVPTELESRLLPPSPPEPN